ncbi:aryl-alcohol-oxidase from pleurotus Eryingii [Dendrothele bispora CBS 962.96]|uniref:Aryl-alcohol-oxidase from pleurotus Eryingii n=1 Tax=Dendrothele bispora (strain CBS 962.96) TaxID=1314807 RepID=A0A4S8L4Z7_DENBC|nr:aryl-alcohol-oxidase from pleurotus Eryingii [Dendrothele bispora CBS 962.96]
MKYDFIIIGGGTAGCVLANRLSEDPSVNILLLEAGGTNIGKLELEVPFLYNFISSENSWNFTTTPQQRLNERALSFQRGYVLGGSSSVNGMMYNRGSKGDWDRYAEVTGDPGWSWNNIQPYIAKNEKFTPPADGHNTSGQYDPFVHSLTGTNAVSLAGFPYTVDSIALLASQQLGGPFEFNLDYNSGFSLGFSWVQFTINGANRSSSAVSYLDPALVRPNLHVLVNARVLRILPDNTATGVEDLHPGSASLKIKTVEFTQGLDNPPIYLTATKELILSSGVVGTPHILLNSGIGNFSSLIEAGITPLVDLPSVGQNFSVHPLSHPVFFVNPNFTTTDAIYQNLTFRAELLQQWSENGTGPLVDSAGGSQIIYMRFSDDILEELGSDPSSSPTSPHFSLGVQNAFYPKSPSSGKYLTFSTEIVSPTSRGSVTLNSTHQSPFNAPLIDVACLRTDTDFLAMRSAIKSVLELVSAPAWNGYILGPFTDLANATASEDPDELDERLDDYIRATASASGHAVGTASMSASDASFGVVNPDLVVKGVKGLRIVDASVLPYIPSGHTQAPVYIVAERAADLIKATWMIGDKKE